MSVVAVAVTTVRLWIGLAVVAVGALALLRPVR